MSDTPRPSHDQVGHPDEHHVRGKFASRLGFMLAAVGSAVGLGNIWLFPYTVGENGGGAFILIYFGCILFVGLPAMLVEFAIGRHGKTSPIGAYRKIAPGTPWWLNGLMGVFAGFVIMSFYSVVAGWVIRYFFVGIFQGFSGFDSAGSGGIFEDFIAGTGGPLCYQFAAIAMTGLIIFFGIENGIERASKYLVPLLGLILLLLVVRSLTLDGGFEGVKFMFQPDFSKIQPKSLVAALGLAAFTLSVGMGAMMTYASYVGDDVHLGRTAVNIAVLDTCVAILAGLAVFPAVFAAKMDPAQGPGLVFVILPQVFAEMPLGRFVGVAFFFLLFVAALTSMISIMEPVVTWLVDDVRLKRHAATLLAGGGIFLVGIPACLSVSGDSLLGGVKIPFLGGATSFFGVLETLTLELMLPLGVMVACIFLLFGWKRLEALKEVAGSSGGHPEHLLLRVWYIVAISVTPIAVFLLLAHTIWAKFQS